MSKKYLLPCSCGESIALDVAQAGQTVTCGCGKPQQAPSLLKMKNLATVEETAPTSSQTSESFNTRLFFQVLGVIILIPSLIFLGWSLSTRPKPLDVTRKQVMFSYGGNTVPQNSTPLPDYEHDILNIRGDDIDYMSPFQVFHYFRTLKSGPVLSYNFQENYQMLKDAYRIRVSAAAIGSGLGLLCLIASLFMPTRTKSVGVRKGAEWK